MHVDIYVSKYIEYLRKDTQKILAMVIFGYREIVCRSIRVQRTFHFSPLFTVYQEHGLL